MLDWLTGLHLDWYSLHDRLTILPPLLLFLAVNVLFWPWVEYRIDCRKARKAHRERGGR